VSSRSAGLSLVAEVRWSLAVALSPLAASNLWAFRLRPAKRRCYMRAHQQRRTTGCPRAMRLFGRRSGPAASGDSPIRRQRGANKAHVTGTGPPRYPTPVLRYAKFVTNQRLSRQGITLERSSFIRKTGELEEMRAFWATCSCHTASILDEAPRPNRPEMRSPGTTLPRSHPPGFPAAGEPPPRIRRTALPLEY
jgi:hypothetical protein